MTVDAIEIRGASTHNLKAIDCRVPHGRVTVVTGPSGAGKSSLAFDTVYAEAQRRFVESMSTYTRQFLEKMERPPVESMEGVLPAVALEAHNSVRNARSTVGTLTEVQDVLRLLFTHLGEVQCPNGHGELLSSTAAQAADRIVERFGGGETLMVLAHLARPKKLANESLAELVRQGYFRVLDSGEVRRLDPSDRWLVRWDPLEFVLGRFRVGPKGRSRLTAAIEEAYGLSGGRVQVLLDERLHYGRGLTCTECGETSPRPSPALFSFNSPLGACPSCQGFGRVVGVDRERVVPDPGKSLRQKPIAVWNSPAFEGRYAGLWQAAIEEGIDLDRPWNELEETERRFVWSGKGDFTNLDKFFRWLERRSYRMHVRVLLSRYRAYEPCAACQGRRLRPEGLRVMLQGRDLGALSGLGIGELHRWLKEQPWSERQLEVAGHLLEELETRLGTLCRVGLDYLGLDRQGRTLSGGEAQRIQLASALGSGLTSTLYVLDEPTIGLHPKDSERLLSLLRDLAAQGNTVLVVEHDRTLIEGADHVIDLGPRAGVQGGEVVAEGPLSVVLACRESLTSKFLRARQGGAAAGPPDSSYAALPRVGVRGATANNLKDIDVDFPVGCLVAVTGVSGSGKSTVVHQVLHDGFQRSRGVVDVEPGACRELVGTELLEDMVLVDQRPLGRSARSNPVTYIKAYDEIRKLYAGTEKAKRAGIKPGHFSFNVKGGRCTACEGTGVQEVDMHFMAAVRVQCDECQGRRFTRRVLEVTLLGLSIAETLELTVDEAMDHFREHKRLLRKLRVLVDVGLGYLHLGQATATLSGGEAQRLKLASFLDGKRRKDERPRLFLFDEPTTGLHMSDIDLLHGTLRRLIERGDGVAVVEHSLDLVARADWIVDLGPEGGERGGEVLFAGGMARFLAEGRGATADELRRHHSRGS